MRLSHSGKGVLELDKTRLDENDIREFIAMQAPRLVGALTLLSGSRPLAEDVVQEALARAWERSERGERIHSLTAWVTKVATNLARSRVRRLLAEHRAVARIGRHQREELAAQARSGQPLTETLIDLRRALAALPRHQREALVLHYYLGFSLREIAVVKGITEGTAKTRLYRARGSLAAKLGDAVARPEADPLQGQEAGDVAGL